jgi:hypothetical protein
MVSYSGSAGVARSARRLNEPRPAIVELAVEEPATVDGARVEVVRDEWRVDERWWTEHPLRRRYFEVVLATGENATVFLDETSGRWFRQRA